MAIQKKKLVEAAKAVKVKSLISRTSSEHVYTEDKRLILLSSECIAVERSGSLEDYRRYYAQQDDETEQEVETEDDEAGKRQAIKTFSRASQANLMRKMAAWIPQHEGRLVFFTLTYPAEFPTSKVAQSHLKKFLRLCRKLLPDVMGPWRKEYQMRGASHYHFVVEGFDPAVWSVEQIRERINELWRMATGIIDGDLWTQADWMRCDQAGKYYLVKELGKSIQAKGAWSDALDGIDHYGRFWGFLNQSKMVFEEKGLVVPVPVAERIREMIQQKVLHRMESTGRVRFDGSKYLFNGGKLEGQEVDPDKLQRWMIFKDAMPVIAEMWDKAWTSDDAHLAGYHPMELPPLTDFIVKVT